MASQPRLTLPLELLGLIYQFLPNGQNRSNFEKTCLKFRNVCLEEEVKEMRQLIELENQYLESPLCEEGIPEEAIEMVEIKIGYKLPFHLREFIKIRNGRRNNHDIETEDENGGKETTTVSIVKLNSSLWHWSCLSPFQDWRYHSPQRVQIGIFENSVVKSIDCVSNGLYIDLKSGLIKVEGGFKSFTMNFKEWMKSCKGFRSNPFNVQKLLSNEKDFKKILKHHGYLYQYLTEEDKKDENFIILALESFPILQFIPENRKKDLLDYIQLAIKCDENNYIHISDNLKKEKDLVKTFIERGGSLSLVPSEAITTDLILSSLQNGGTIDKDILNKYSDNEEFLERIVEIVVKPSSNQVIGNFLVELVKNSKISERIQKKIFENDPAFMFLSIGNKNPINKKVALKIFETKLYENSHLTRVFTTLPKDLQIDKQVVEIALLTCFEIYPMISEELKMDKQFNLQLLTKLLKQSSRNNQFQDLKPLYDVWGKDEEFLRLTFNTNPSFIIDYPKLLDETFVNSLECHYGKLSFGEILKLNPYQGYRLAVRRNKSHPAHDLVEAKDTLQDIRKALPKEDDPETLADIRQSLLSSVWYDYW